MTVAYNSDCMEAMAQMEDNAFDLAIVDPPYGIGMAGGKRYDRPSRPNSYHTKTKHKLKEWDNERPPIKYFKELNRVSKNQIICGANYFVEFLTPSMGWIYWGKMEDESNFSDGELFYTSFNRALKSVYYHQFHKTNGGKTRIHPTQKPIALYKWLLKNYAKEGDRILDTHLGSGSSRIAAHEMGFDFTGYEIDKDYFDAQEKRFQNHIKQQSLFQPNEMY